VEKPQARAEKWQAEEEERKSAESRFKKTYGTLKIFPAGNYIIQDA